MSKSQPSFAGIVRPGAYALLAGVLLSACGSRGELVIGGNADTTVLTPSCVGPPTPPTTGPVHRYSFNDTGTTVTDSIGMANGVSTVFGATTVAAAQLDGTGRLALDGVEQYVDLPNGLVSSLTDATFMAWTAWRGGAAYQRIFDFGTSMGGEGVRDQCKSCVLLMTSSGAPQGTGLCAQVHTPAGEEQIAVGQELDKNFRQVTLVFTSGTLMELYLDATRIGSTPITAALSDIVDNNDWLGLSQYITDNNYGGSYDEFRIYDHALSACEIEATFDAGPDAL